MQSQKVGESSPTRFWVNGSVAQLDRALHYGCRGLGFDSLLSHKSLLSRRLFYVSNQGFSIVTELYNSKLICTGTYKQHQITFIKQAGTRHLTKTSFPLLYEWMIFSKHRIHRYLGASATMFL